MAKRIIYMVTNLVNGKIYIGKDSRNRKNYFGSGKAIQNSISKYGIENFKKEIIDEANSLDELNEKESYWISFYRSHDPSIGYNRSLGGEGNWDLSYMTPDEIKQMEERRRISFSSDEFKEKKRKNTIDYFKDPENRKKQSETLKRYWRILDYSKKEEIKDRLLEGTRRRWDLKGEREKASEYFKRNNPMFSEDLRKKMSEERTGENNPFSKKCEINGVTYSSIVDACNSLGLTRNQISYRIRSINYPEYRKI